MQPIIKSKIICPTCKAVGYQLDTTTKHYIGELNCATCSGRGYLTKLEDLDGLECHYPIIHQTTGEFLAHSKDGQPIRITPELANMILEGQAFIDVEIGDELYIIDVAGNNPSEVNTIEQILRMLYRNTGVPLSRLREVWEGIIIKNPINDLMPPTVNWFETEDMARFIMSDVKKE